MVERRRWGAIPDQPLHEFAVGYAAQQVYRITKGAALSITFCPYVAHFCILHKHTFVSLYNIPY